MNQVQLVETLIKSISRDSSESNNGKELLRAAADVNMSEFIKSLSDVFVDVNLVTVIRRVSGLELIAVLKRIKSEHNHQQWLSFPVGIREHVKKNVSLILWHAVYHRTAVVYHRTANIYLGHFRYLPLYARNQVARIPPTCVCATLLPLSCPLVNGLS